MTTEFVITEGEKPKRLDVLLANRKCDLSRSDIQHSIGKVFLRRKIAKLARRSHQT